MINTILNNSKKSLVLHHTNQNQKVMKKLIPLFVIALFLSIGTAYSQAKDSSKTTPVLSQTVNNSDNFRKFRIGVYGNIGSSWMSPKNKSYTKNGSRFSVGWGLTFDYNFTENYTFNSGFNLGNYGGGLIYKDLYINSAGDTVKGMMTRKYKFKYLSIPLNLKLKTNQIGYFTYFFQIGLNNSFRLSALGDDNFTPENTTYMATNESGVDIAGETALYRLSFIVGAGAEYQISKSLSAFASLTYDNGLTNSLKGNNAVNPNVKANAIVNNLALTVGFLF